MSFLLASLVAPAFLLRTDETTFKCEPPALDEGSNLPTSSAISSGCLLLLQTFFVWGEKEKREEGQKEGEKNKNIKIKKSSSFQIHTHTISYFLYEASTRTAAGGGSVGGRACCRPGRRAVIAVLRMWNSISPDDPQPSLMASGSSFSPTRRLDARSAREASTSNRR